MRQTMTTTVARLIYGQNEMPDFARLVARMDESLGGFRAHDRGFDWNSDNIAIFDIDHCRIALAISEGAPGSLGCLIVTVGPNGTAPSDDAGPFRPQSLCSALVEEIRSRHACDEVLWAELADPVTADSLDDLLRLSTAAAAKQTVPTAEIVELRPHDPELARIRAALYPEENNRGRKRPAPTQADNGNELSPQMRVAVHAMNATLIIALLPVGAAVTTYTLLRGADMRISGRAMALAGFALTVAHSQFGQTFLSSL